MTDPSDDLERSTALDLSCLAGDLAPIVGDARIVLLGEATHGDGTGMLAMSELVRSLHLDHGFSRLVFESPAWSVRRGWEAFLAGQPPGDAAAIGVYSFWARGLEMQGLWQHIAAHAHGPSPLRLDGMDCRLTGRPAIEELLHHLGDPPDGLATIRAAMFDDHAAGAAAVAAWPRAASAEAAAAIDAMLQWCAAQVVLERDPLDRDAYSARDRLMGEEVLRIAASAPDERIVVWAASFHSLGRSDLLQGETYDGVPHADMTRTGDVICRALGESAVRTIALTAGSGAFGQPSWDAPIPIDAPPTEGFEARAAALHDRPRVLRPDPGVYPARPMGHSDVTAPWSEIVDGFLFVPLMRPMETAR